MKAIRKAERNSVVLNRYPKTASLSIPRRREPNVSVAIRRAEARNRGGGDIDANIGSAIAGGKNGMSGESRPVKPRGERHADVTGIDRRPPDHEPQGGNLRDGFGFAG